MRPRNLARKLLIAILWLGIWAAAAQIVGKTLLLPSPLETLRALWQLGVTSAFWLAVGSSVLRILAGFALGLAVGALLAALTSRYRWWRDFFAPFLSVVKATPVASFIILALVWIRTNGVPVFATFLIVLPIVSSNLSEGILSTDKDLLEMARAFAMPWHMRLRRIYWPTVRPYLRAAITTGMGMAWKGGVAAEVIATPRVSLGGYLYNAKIYLDTPGLFAATAMVILLSILLEKAIVLLATDRGKGENNA